jgi:hypothetical protein
MYIHRHIHIAIVFFLYQFSLAEGLFETIKSKFRCNMTAKDFLFYFKKDFVLAGVVGGRFI